MRLGETKVGVTPLMAYPEWRNDLPRLECDEFVEFAEDDQKSVVIHQAQVAQSQPETMEKFKNPESIQ